MNPENEIRLKGKNLELKQNYPFRIGLISDLHIGAQQGLFPTDFTDEYGTKIEINEGQKKLWKYFNDYLEKLNAHKTNILVIVGDIISGKNEKGSGEYMMNVELDAQQIPAAVKIIEHIYKQVPSIERIVITKGTPYHGSKEFSVEDTICDKAHRALGGKVEISYAGEYFYLNLFYNNILKRIFIAHPAAATGLYPETAMGRDIGQFLQKIAEGKLPDTCMIIRAHAHEFLELHKQSIRYLQLPCWQFFVPYDGAVKNFAKYQPDIGGVILMADDQLRLRAFHFLYPNINDPHRYLVATPQVPGRAKQVLVPEHLVNPELKRIRETLLP